MRNDVIKLLTNQQSVLNMTRAECLYQSVDQSEDSVLKLTFKIML